MRCPRFEGLDCRACRAAELIERLTSCARGSNVERWLGPGTVRLKDNTCSSSTVYHNALGKCSQAVLRPLRVVIVFHM